MNSALAELIIKYFTFSIFQGTYVFSPDKFLQASEEQKSKTKCKLNEIMKSVYKSIRHSQCQRFSFLLCCLTKVLIKCIKFLTKSKSPQDKRLKQCLPLIIECDWIAKSPISKKVTENNLK